MNTKHTPEPWRAVPANCKLKTWFIGSANKSPMPVHVEKVRRKADAERIVACVNACAGFSAQELETLGHFKAMHETIAAENEKLRTERNELVAQRDKLLAVTPPKSVAPILQAHFKYLRDGLVWINRNKIDVLTIMDAGRFSEGVHVIYRESPARKEASHE